MCVGIEMPLLNGGFKAVDAPGCYDSRAVAEQLFEEASRSIRDEWVSRKKSKSDKVNDWLQIVCYKYLSFVIDYQHSEIFDERIKRLSRNARGWSEEVVNPFQHGLLALFAHDKGCLSGDDRKLFGKRLWFAYRHYVPAEFLVGFLWQYWKDEPEYRQHKTVIVPELKQWVWFRRSVDSAPATRGLYPSDIEENVRTFQNVAPIIEEASRRKTGARAKRRDDS